MPTEHSCELVYSFYLKSLLGSSFLEENADMTNNSTEPACEHFASYS